MNSVHFNFEGVLSQKCKAIRSSFLREILDSADTNELISFAGGLPNPELFPVDQLKNAFDRVMSENPRTTFQYAGSQGYLPLREWIADRYFKRFNVHVSPDNILITNGSQQALDLVGKLFLDERDTILMEKPSYIGAIQAFSAYNVSMKQITLENDGISIPELTGTLLHCDPKFLYSIPNFQNPGGISYSTEKRHQLAEILMAKRLTFVEDDPYGEIYFAGTGYEPVSFIIPRQSILTGSFSKMISPGIRAGWMVVNDTLKPYLMKAKQGADLHTNNVVQHLIYRFLVDYDIDEHLDKIRNHYRIQKDAMLNHAYHYLPEGTQLTNPSGGMFIWAKLPYGYNTGQLLKYALEERIIYVPGRTFFIDDEGDNCMRLNFTNSTPAEIEEGMIRLKRAVDKYIKANVSVQVF